MLNKVKHPIPSGIRLQMLIQNYHTKILKREKDNDKFIYLYNIGTYWVAFERSACLLNGIFPKGEVSLFMVSGYLDYVVMVSVSNAEIALGFRKHIILRDEVDYKMVNVAPLSIGDYQRWHIGVVKLVL